ncbi:MAG TPA: hypothetical protein VMA83_12690 [Solirubrobacteraceae bacterium]|nr:hypothetical protein [Solirubrobacteraceae bacterium]
MKRAAAISLGSLALALAVPALAPAALVEINEIGVVTKPGGPMCPHEPCEVLTRTTGYQSKVVATGLFAVPRGGRLVAWTVSLGHPNASQVAYFRSREGGPAEAGIEVLAPVRKAPHTTTTYGYKLVGAGPVERIGGFFGRTATFTLETTIRVSRGDVIALNVPTWAPVLACENTERVTVTETVNGKETRKTRTVCKASGPWSWRASRSKAACLNTSTPTNQTLVGSLGYYECLYHGVRLTYSATVLRGLG